MRFARVVLPTVVGLGLAAACGERQVPPPPVEQTPAPQVLESLPTPPDTLVGDSVMARDTARIPR